MANEWIDQRCAQSHHHHATNYYVLQNNPLSRLITATESLAHGAIRGVSFPPRYNRIHRPSANSLPLRRSAMFIGTLILPSSFSSFAIRPCSAGSEKLSRLLGDELTFVGRKG